MHDSRPSISVVVPTCDRPRQLARALASVLAQSFASLEVLVIDDGHRQRVGDAVDSFGDPRLRYFSHPTSLGASAARNTGIRNARGDFIALLDDDDTWRPDKLALQWRRFQRSRFKPGIVYGACQEVMETTGHVFMTSAPSVRGSAHRQSLDRCILMSPTPLVARQCFEAVGLYDERFPASQDREMWIRITRRFPVDFVDPVVASRYIHDRQITANLPRKVKARSLLYDKFRGELERYPQIKAKHLDALNRLYAAANDNGSARNALRELAHTRGARRYKPRLRLAISILSPTLYGKLMAMRFKSYDGLKHYY